MGALHDAVLAAGTEKDRKRIKAQAWQSVSPDKDYQVTYRGHTITLTATIDASSDDAVFTMTVHDGTTDITPPSLNPIRVVNPPYMVEDASGDITLTYLDGEGQEQTKKAREDPLMRIVYELQHLADKVIDGA